MSVGAVVAPPNQHAQPTAVHARWSIGCVQAVVAVLAVYVGQVGIPSTQFSPPMEMPMSDQGYHFKVWGKQGRTPLLHQHQQSPSTRTTLSSPKTCCP
eukprot:12559616-Ditylum_brightwellii.AAC.1